MDKKLLKTVLAVLLGISVFVILGAVVSLIFEASFADDLSLVSSISNEVERIINYVKNTSIAVICIAVPVLVAVCMACFAKSKKVLSIIAALATLLLAAVCIAFVCDLHGITLEGLDATAYATATQYYTELLAVAVPALILCAYFTGATVHAFIGQKNAPEVCGEVTHEEN